MNHIAVNTLVNALEIILPVLFVIALGFGAGRTKQFDSDQVAGLNALVLNFALPALLFVSIAGAPRAVLFAEAPFVLALLIAGLGLFVMVALISVFVLRHSVGAAAIQAACVSLANVAFAGTPILTPLFGKVSLVSIATAALVLNVTIVPSMVTMLEYDRQRAAGGASGSLGALIGRSLANSFKQPYVWAPLLAMVLVLLGVSVPTEIDNMLALIGSATAGVALFVSGIILAAFRITITLEIIANTLGKAVVQPAIMALLVTAFMVAQPLRSEGIIICTLATAVLTPMIAVRYKVYEAQAASTFLLTTLSMVVVVPLAITVTR